MERLNNYLLYRRYGIATVLSLVIKELIIMREAGKGSLEKLELVFTICECKQSLFDKLSIMDMTLDIVK